jgi:DmsE family decaheme c-type cytochrome
MQRIRKVSLGAWFALAILVAAGMSGCAADRETALLPPVLTEKVPTAEAVGTFACEDCHNVEPDFYRDSPHKLAFFRDGINAGCESCHGAGSVHSEYFYENDDYEDDPHDLVSSDDLRALNESERSSLCQQCHQADFPLWPTTDHARADVGCWSCHPADLHAPQPGAVELSPVVGAQSDNDFCLQCHEAVGPEFALQFHHRVPEGQMKCADCHSIHGEAKTNSIVQGESAACLSCHTEIQGPFVYEHVGMEEGCSSCHEPHGSVNNKLLTTNDNSLCLQCHYQEVASQFGREPHGGFLRGGALCYDCHTQIHGSNTDRNFNPRRNE